MNKQVKLKMLWL